MRIGIDARQLAEPITGIGRYTAELTRELVSSDNDFFIYTPKPPIVGSWNQQNISIRASQLHGRAGKLLWSQTLLPYQIKQDSIDVFWGTTHRLPRYLPQSTARVVTIHDLVWKFAGETMRPVNRWLEQRLMPEAVHLADRILADSHNTADALEAEFPITRGKVHVVHLGATPLNPPESKNTLSQLGVDRPYFLFVGTLEPRKNLQRLIHAFAQLPENIRKTNMLVIAGGKGWGGVDVHQLLKSAAIEKDVRVFGYVSDTQLSTLYSHARFLAMPSLYEGFGLPLVEAMSCGTPVLTSNSSSLPEVAGDAGLLVDPLDEKAIADAVLLLLTDDIYHTNLSAKAKPNAQRFSWTKAAQKTLAVFTEAAHERQATISRKKIH